MSVAQARPGSNDTMDHTIASSSSASVMPETVNKPGLTSGTKEVRSFDGIDDDADLDYHGHLRNAQNDDGFTRTDAREMKRMGKKQELRRNFRTLSTIAFTIILQGTWEVLLTATTQGMINGGIAGLVWSYIWTFFGFTFVVFSLAEMASMCPTVRLNGLNNSLCIVLTIYRLVVNITGFPNSLLPHNRRF
jgi:hypothetical protein